jgi:hypothetical protein
MTEHTDLTVGQQMGLVPSDPLFFRTKIEQGWVEEFTRF